jgi:hypothetical protein
VLDDVERALAAQPLYRPGTRDQLALVCLAHVDVDGGAHHDGRMDGLERHRVESLQRMALERGRRPAIAAALLAWPAAASPRGTDRTARRLDASARSPSMSIAVTSAPSTRSTPDDRPRA